MDRFQYIEPKPIGKCACCDSNVYEDTYIDKYDDDYICSETCIVDYARKELGVVHGRVDKEGEVL